MSISSQISRLQSAKSDIASAISSKGVSVPSGAKLDDMAALIRSIEMEPVAKRVSFTPNSSLLNYSTYTESCYKMGNLVVLQFSIVLSKATDWNVNSIKIGTIESSCRPKSDKTMLGMAFILKSGNLSIRASVEVDTSGGVYMKKSSAVSDVLSFVVHGIGYVI